jgi:hypothetical protein
MVKIRLKARENSHSLLAGAVACLFLLQTLGIIFSANGRIVFSNGDGAASIIMADEVCHANSGDSGKTPAQQAGHHHCILCAIGNNDHDADAVALAASVVILPAPQSENGNARGWSLPDDLPSLPVGWSSSWSSRAPPSIS